MINISVVLYDTNPELILNVSNKLVSNLVCNVFFIDNSVGDKLKEYIPDEFYYLHCPHNPGYGAGHNIAIRKSIEQNTKYHLVLNADVDFDPVIIDELIFYMELHPDVGQLMPKVLNYDGTVQYLCKLIPTPMDLIFRRFIPLGSWKERNNNKFELRFTSYNKIIEVPYLSGCFMLLKIDALKDVGLFDERFFMYPEDIDLTRRINQKYKTVFYPDATITHEHGMASYKNIKMLVIHAWNMVKYFNKWGWFFDGKRSETNKRILNDLDYTD